MVVNSFSFLIFFIVVFFIYYFPLKENTKLQNWFLLFSSYFFYGFADWRMIPVILTATFIFFKLGILINNASSTKKASQFTTLGIILGIGVLFYFKYFNFFIESFSNLFNLIGLKININTFNIIMPLGVSFFIFKLISYIIEINREKIKPTNNIIIFSTYIAFFPTILSGPIDRPNTFIPQLQKKRKFNYDLAVDGSKQILWGLFQKMVIADNTAPIVNNIWENFSNQSGSVLLITAILYSFQLYADFAGYSNMAIGVGKILGFNITKNFNYPFFSKNIAEFWRKWHMSLTSWLTDYVFIPLNIKFRQYGKQGIILAIIINMITVGIWHGANWTFIVFGLFHGLLFIPLILSGSVFKKKKISVNKYNLPKFIDFIKIIGTFLLVTLSLIIFRAENVTQAINYTSNIISKSLISFPHFQEKSHLLTLIILITIFIIVEWQGKNNDYPIKNIKNIKNRYLRWSIYSLIIFIIGLYMQTNQSPFIYFQF